MNCTDFENRLLTVRIMVILLEVDGPVINSSAMCDQGRCEMARGWSGIYGSWIFPGHIQARRWSFSPKPASVARRG